MKKVWLLLFSILWISGCGILPSPEETIEPPKTNNGSQPHETTLPEQEDQIESLTKNILEKLPDQAKLAKVNHLEGEEDFLYDDLDGDGEKEVLLAYKLEDEQAEVHVAIFQKKDNEWQSVWDVKGSGYNVDHLTFADVNGDQISEIIIGWSIGASVGNGLDIYEWNSGKPSLLINTAYHKIELFKKNSETLIALWQKDTGLAYMVEVYRVQNEKLVSAKDTYKDYFPKVVDYYLKLLDEYPDAAVLWYYLADAEIKAGDYDSAIEHAKEGKKYATNYPSQAQFEEIIQRAKNMQE